MFSGRLEFQAIYVAKEPKLFTFQDGNRIATILLGRMVRRLTPHVSHRKDLNNFPKADVISRIKMLRSQS